MNVIEYRIVAYFDESRKQRIKENSNEVEGSNLLVYPAVTRKLRYVTTTEHGLVNPYQKPQRLMMCLLELFLNEGDWILDLFSGTGKVLYNVHYGLHKVKYPFNVVKVIVILFS